MKQVFPIEKILNSIRNAHKSVFYKHLWENCSQVKSNNITYDEFVKIPLH